MSRSLSESGAGRFCRGSKWPGFLRMARQWPRLSLAARQLNTALSRRGSGNPRETGDELVGVGLVGRLDHLGLGRARFAVGDVLQDRAAEQQHILRHDRHLPTQIERSYSRASLPSIRMRRYRGRTAATATKQWWFPGPARPHQSDPFPSPPTAKRLARPARPDARGSGRSHRRNAHRRAACSRGFL